MTRRIHKAFCLVKVIPFYGPSLGNQFGIHQSNREPSCMKCPFLEEFKKSWGFSFSVNPISTCADAKIPECAWVKDMADIFTALNVVDNNGPQSIWRWRHSASSLGT